MRRAEGALGSEPEVGRHLCSSKYDLPQDASPKVILSGLASAGQLREGNMSTAAGFSKNLATGSLEQ